LFFNEIRTDLFDIHGLSLFWTLVLQETKTRHAEKIRFIVQGRAVQPEDLAKHHAFKIDGG